MNSIKVKTNHLLYIDSIRALAAIYVVLHHAVLQYYNHQNHHLTKLKELTIKPFYFGHYAVDLFIVLSGFSLMLSVTKNGYTLKGGVLLFFRRRIIRIVPTYYFAMLISLLLITLFIGDKTGTQWDSSIPVYGSDILNHALFINDFYSSTSAHINHAMWSIAVEFRIYLFFPLLVFLYRKAGALATLGSAVVISILGSSILLYLNQYNPDINLTSSGVSPYIILFTFGMIAADLSFSDVNLASSVRKAYYNLSRLKKNIYFGILILLVLSCLKYLLKANNIFENRVDTATKLIDIIMGALSGLVLFICSSRPPLTERQFWLTKMLSWKPLFFIGTFSYSLYLIHPPLLQIISQYILAPLQISQYAKTWLLLALGTPLIILCSYLFFLLFESPFLTMGKKVSIKTAEANAVVSPAP